jgi:hypothetical protein
MATNNGFAMPSEKVVGTLLDQHMYEITRKPTPAGAGPATDTETVARRAYRTAKATSWRSRASSICSPPTVCSTRSAGRATAVNTWAT